MPHMLIGGVEYMMILSLTAGVYTFVCGDWRERNGCARQCLQMDIREQSDQVCRLSLELCAETQTDCVNILQCSGLRVVI